MINISKDRKQCIIPSEMLQITFQTTKDINSLLVRKHQQLKSYKNWNWGSMLMKTALVHYSNFKESKILDVFENSASVPVWTVFSVLLELTIVLKLEGELRTMKNRNWRLHVFGVSLSSISSFKKQYLKNICLFTCNYLVWLKRAMFLLSFVFLLPEVLFVFACKSKQSIQFSFSVVWLFTYIFHKCFDTVCFLLLLNKNQMFFLSCQGWLVHPL